MADQLKTLAVITVATAGSRQAISTSKSGQQGAVRYPFARTVRFEADKNNTGVIFVGDSNVSSTRYTTQLIAGDSYEIHGSLIDMARLYVDTDTNGSKVQVSYA